MTRLKREQSSYDAPNPGSRSLAPSSSEVTSCSTRAAKPSPTAAAPAHRTFFDPWNSSSTGHQRAENRLSGSTAWRVSRNLKLAEQYKAGLDGGKRLAYTVGAGSRDFGRGGRKPNGAWETGAKGLRTGGQQSLVEAWTVTKPSKTSLQALDNEASVIQTDGPLLSADEEFDCGQDADSSNLTGPDLDLQDNLSGTLAAFPKKHIFSGLCFYINGSTAPLVSDHKLKQLLAAHGARHSIALGRRSVTHVVLGIVCTQGGAGGGLAASKIQKEITRTGGKAVKFVTAEWVLESIKADRRLPESRFSPLTLAPKTQNSVLRMMRASSAPKSKQEQG
ncbi:hypothetical protein BKA66DRAFT_293853 [Pyrenochaeta sp. MPI-SDFR-AT-0127]|nr:hypothetical protein BKA66DRAFT_293853 [Pyrenochaeta sp. MPI-SDFR-AT-0127]